MNPEMWKLVVSIGTLLLTVVTAPFLWAIRAESKAIRTEIKLAAAELKAEANQKFGELSKDMVEMEGRLNQRIDTRLVHR